MTLDMMGRVREEMRRQLAADEEMLRELLGGWVSELEPAMVYQNGKFIGLTAMEFPLGSYAPVYKGRFG